MLRLPLHKLTSLFPDHTPTTVKGLLVLTQALLLGRTTCLNRLKGHVATVTGKSGTAADSHYKFLIRFFDTHAAGELWIRIVAVAIKLVGLRDDYLILDGTSWKGPTGWTHLLTLCVIYRGVAVPIAWVDLAKRGSSSVAERTALLDLAFAHYDLRGKILLADREYIGLEWFNYLIDNSLQFCIRSRNLAYFPLVDRSAPGQPRLRRAIEAVTASRKPNKATRFAFRFTPDGPLLWLVIARNPDPKATERVMYLITSVDQSAYRTVADYLKRWKIEHCFRHLKSNGFHLESVNLRTPERQRLLVAVVAFAYVVGVSQGLRTFARAVAIKKHGADGKRYRAVSVFRYGIDQLGARFRDLVTFCRYLLDAFASAFTRVPDARTQNV